jgi:1-aminocyclopropane-1-carboxylate deaminase/D-cysteine desulfhydrase-like pyridoxal-dependent ACC family enzyme
LLRGDEPDLPDGNLLLDRMLGARTTFITHAEWPDRDALMETIAAEHAASGGVAYAIPEGGSNALGCLGYVVCVQELLEQERLEGLEIRRVVHATGSGGTTAGLALGFAAAGRDDVEVVGVAVCDDRATFDAKVGAICDAAVEAGAVTAAVRARTRWTLAEGYQGDGYGKTTPAELEEIAQVARREGVLLDPVYSGKAWLGLLGEVAAGRLGRDDTTVFLHTGGIFGLWAFRREIGALPPA